MCIERHIFARLRIACLLAAVALLALPLRADVVSAKVTVTTSATALAEATFTDGRKHVEVSHACASSIFVGGAAVTTATGREITSAQTLSMTLIGGETLYAIYASGTCVVTVLRNGGS